MSNLIQSIHGENGYTTEFCLSNDELDILRQLIRIQWLYRIQLLVPRHIKQFDEYGITRYHELSHLLDHPTAWPTFARVLPRESANIIKKLSFFKKLESDFGAIEVGDEQDLGWDNIYWRLVRPGRDDIGSLHADKWFWDLLEYGGTVPSYPYERLKIWIAIYTTSGKNGLLVVPRSHLKKDWKWHVEIKYNQKKPIIDEPIENLNLTLLPTEPGRAVIFHDDLLHGGSENLATTTRVSMEFTLFIPAEHKNINFLHTQPAEIHL